MYCHNFLLSRYATQSTGSFHAAASARPFVRQCHFYRFELILPNLYNVCFIKIRSKHNIDTLLSLLRIFMEHTIFFLL